MIFTKSPALKAAGMAAATAATAATAALALGIVMRVSYPSLTPFGLDEGFASILTVQLTHGGQIPLTGLKTSLHFYNPPLLPWLLAPAFALSRDPAWATLGIAALGVLAVLGMGWCARRLSAGRWAVGLAALMLAALAPAWIEHSRRLWGHAFMLPCAVGVMLLTIRWIMDGRRWALAGIVGLIAAAQALHFSGSLLWGAVGLAWLTTPRRPRLEWKPIGLGAAVALLWYGPYAIHLLRTNFLDARIIVSALGGGRLGSGASVGDPLHSFFLILSDLGHNDAVGGDAAMIPGLAAACRIARGLSCAGIVAGLAAAAVGWRRERRAFASTRAEATANAAGQGSGMGQDTPLIALPLWRWGLCFTVLPPAVFSILRVTFVSPYLLPAAPGAALLVAGVIGLGLERRGKLSGLAASVPVMTAALLAIWCAGAAAMGWGIFRHIKTAGPDTPVFTTLDTQRRAALWIVERAGDAPALIMQGNRDPKTGVDYGYFYLLWAETNTPERFLDHEGWQRLFVIQDSKDRLAPEFLAGLRGAERQEFGNVRLYAMNKSE